MPTNGFGGGCLAGVHLSPMSRPGFRAAPKSWIPHLRASWRGGLWRLRQSITAACSAPPPAALFGPRISSSIGNDVNNISFKSLLYAMISA